ncbi:MAG: NYN domain-containing protein, partial [Pseudanabaena sp. RU_4_16]|nr:NYN domain-containing protein [Pseudanabaena sp. RU_4_16]
MLVDGYNVLGAWRSLQSIRDVEGFDSARQELVEI